MKIKKILLTTTLLAGTMFATSSMAQVKNAYSSPDSVKHPFSVGANIGTSMVGLEATYKLNNYIEPRVFGNYFQLTVNNFSRINSVLKDLANDNLPVGEITSLNIPSEFKFVYTNLGMAIDIHPFKNGFFISAGGAYNNTHASFSLNGSGIKAEGHIPGVGVINADGSNINLTINGVGNINLHDDIGNAKVEVKWNKFAPYIGLGFRGNFAEANLEDPSFLENLGFIFEVGAFYYGKPTVKVSAHTGVIDQSKINELNKEIKDQIDPYTKYASFWPTVRLGLSYRF